MHTPKHHYTEKDYDNIIAIIKQAIESVNTALKNPTAIEISYKNRDTSNPVTTLDTSTQQLYKNFVIEHLSNSIFIGEEGEAWQDTITTADNEQTIIYVDPLDGSWSLVAIIRSLISSLDKNLMDRLWQVATLRSVYHAQNIIATFIGNIGENNLLYYHPSTDCWPLILRNFNDDTEETITYNHKQASSQPLALLWQNKELNDQNLIPHFATETIGLWWSRSNIIGQMCRNHYSGVIIDPWEKEPRDRLPMMWVPKQMWYNVYTRQNNERTETSWDNYINPQKFALEEPIMICHPETFTKNVLSAA